MEKEHFMQEAIKLAKLAQKNKDVPVGAVIVYKNKIISKAYNQKEIGKNAVYHAEIIAIEKACRKLKNFRLDECEIYITFEPCIMCVGAILSARIKKVYFGAFDNRYGACKLLQNNNFNYICDYEGGILKEECSLLLSNFFSNIRIEKKKEVEVWK